MRRTESREAAETNLIDTRVDTQNERSDFPVHAGVSDLRVLYNDGSIAIPVLLTIQTSTGAHRGVHMSRLVHAASSHNREGIESWLRQICGEVNRTQPGARISCAFELPYADQFVPVTVRTTEKGAITYFFTANGMTACPCSKSMIGVGHMQRAEIRMELEAKKPVDMVWTIKRMGECFSAVPTEKMKRTEEAKKIIEAQENARFAEDLVRECVSRFPGARSVTSRCFESIHAHDAVASWSRSRTARPPAR